MNSLEQAELAGFDLSLIEESLRCTHEQRAIQHQEALTLVLELERVGRELLDAARLFQREDAAAPSSRS